MFTRHGHTWTQTARITDPDDAAPAGFGNSVSLRGKTLVVGAATAADDQGAAYVFRSHRDAWVREARLTASDPAPEALFGFSTAIDDDTIAIGAARGLDDAGVATGSAYVFERGDHGWSQRARLVPAGGQPGDVFGHRLAIGDGSLAVGSNVETNPAGVTTGAAHLYRAAHHAWIQQAMVFPSDGTQQGQFTSSLATDGRTLVVGNGFQHSENVRPFPGEAYVYDLDR